MMNSKISSCLFPMRARLIVSTLTVFVLTSTALGAQSVDPQTPEYQSVGSIRGSMTSTGSDTLANLMTFWTEDFKRFYPGVQTTVNSAGSSTAPPAMASGASSLGPMSRKMKAKEIDAFKKHYGYEPTAIPVAVDALAVFVHRRNPLKGLNIQQIDAMFSTTRKCGLNRNILSWQQVDKSFEKKKRWKNKSIALFGRNSASGTYGYFKKVGLCKGDFASEVNEQGGSAGVVQAIGTNRYAIGYSGIGYLTSKVKAIPIAAGSSKHFVEPTAANAVNGSYPLARFLYIYVNQPPGKPLPALEREFVRLILSKQGQQTVLKSGYIPLPIEVIRDYRKKI